MKFRQRGLSFSEIDEQTKAHVTTALAGSILMSADVKFKSLEVRETNGNWTPTIHGLGKRDEAFASFAIMVAHRAVMPKTTTTYSNEMAENLKRDAAEMYLSAKGIVNEPGFKKTVFKMSLGMIYDVPRDLIDETANNVFPEGFNDLSYEDMAQLLIHFNKMISEGLGDE